MSRTALVTGANRGIGFEVCRRLARKGLRILLTARDANAGRDAASLLRRDGLDVRFEPLDVSTHASVLACAERLKRAGVHV
ncbi:MAG: SDR family NAD(P)-dependent oxidoreductase, partial [Chloroflexi bacterium]|nr:SDR family NAD(P)-dependent oxidoreductase [Chloroflexota bacterium]